MGVYEAFNIKAYYQRFEKIIISFHKSWPVVSKPEEKPSGNKYKNNNNNGNI